MFGVFVPTLLYTLFCFIESNRVLLTELTLDPEEFDSYNIGVNSEITFCLKELRVGISSAATEI